MMRLQASNLDPQTPAGWRLAPGPALVALVVFVSLLLAFYQVVSGGVQQAEQRRHAAAAEADAAWRCNAQSAARQRMSCLTDQRATARDDAGPAQAQLATLAHAVR